MLKLRRLRGNYNMQNKVKVLIIKPNDVYTKVLNDDYRDFKKEINISSPITCIQRKIGGKYFDIWCDDEGLFKVDDNGTIQATGFCRNVQEILAGNIMIANNDGEGNVLSLSDEDIDLIKTEIRTLIKDIIVEYNTSLGPCNMRFDKGCYVLKYEA